MIAIALAVPDILIADEPTTALSDNSGANLRANEQASRARNGDYYDYS